MKGEPGKRALRSQDKNNENTIITPSSSKIRDLLHLIVFEGYAGHKSLMIRRYTVCVKLTATFAT